MVVCARVRITAGLGWVAFGTLPLNGIDLGVVSQNSVTPLPSLPNPTTHFQVSETFSEIINSGDYMLLDVSDGTLKPAEVVLGNLFTAKLDSLPLLSPKAEQFFRLLRRLVGVGGSWLEPASFVMLLTSKLHQFTVPVTDPDRYGNAAPRINESCIALPCLLRLGNRAPNNPI